MKPISFSSPAPSPKNYEKITKFRGINKRTDATLIENNQATDMLNMQLDSEGILQRFLGYTRAYPTLLSGSNYGLAYNPKINKFVLSNGGKLYTFIEGNNPIELYNGIASANMESFFMNDKQYFFNGTDYLQFDGTTVVTVESVAYVPTLTLGRTPTGGGTVNEAFNLLSPKFKDSFSSPGAVTAYTLSLNGLDATPVTAVVNGVNKVETTDFTVNRTTGVVTFTVAPTAGTNNVVIQAAKTIAGNADKIKNCTLFTVFGGQNDTRVFMSGNPNFKNVDFRSGLYDPTYFPDTGYTKVGSDVTAIKGYAKQYSTCLILKEDSNQDSTVYLRSFQINDDGSVSFPVVQGNAGIGVKASKSIQTIEDSPLFLSSKGVYRFSGGSVKDERSMHHLSGNLDSVMLNESNSNNAVSFDYDGKYGIAYPSGNVYVFDYRNKFIDTDGLMKYEAYMWNNIHSKSFLEVNGTLYFADSTKGMVYKFIKETDVVKYQIDSETFESYWYGKIFSFNADNYKKLVERVDLTLSPTYSRNSAELYYRTNKKEEEFVKEYRLVTFDFNNVDFNDFEFTLSAMPQSYGKKVKAKKIIYFQPIVKCSKINEGMTINSMTLQYLYQSQIR